MKRTWKKFVPGFIRNGLREFRWPPGLVRWLPGSSRHFGPPRRWLLLRDYFAGHPGHLREVLPAQSLRRPQPEFVGPVSARFCENFSSTVPPAAVFTLPDARLLGAEGWIVAPGDCFLLDAAFEANDPAKRLRDYHVFRSRQGRAPALRRLPGRCLSLASDYAAGGFGHFIHDSLTRLLLVERAGLRLAEFDWIYLPHLDTPVTRHLLARLELAPGRLLNHVADQDLWCENLTATSFPGTPGNIAPPYAEFLRQRFAPVPRRRDRRIYLSRHGYRRNFSNQPEVEELLREHGFEEVRAHEDGETLQKCAEAAFVFCIEGANFFNAVFCPVGTRVLLVYPDRLPHGVPYVLTLAEAAGFPTLMLSGETVGPPGVDGGIADIYVDPANLRRGLERLLAA